MTNNIGDLGESIANILLSQKTQQGFIFQTVKIGGKWPTIDIYAEIISDLPNKMFCFFQIKGTERGYTKSGKKLKVQIDKEHVNRLSKYLAPSYLIGVDINSFDIFKSEAYIGIIRGKYKTGISSMTTAYKLNVPNLILLKNEIEEFWNNTNCESEKLNYKTNFKL